MPSTVKELLQEIASRLPDDCTWDEAMEPCYLRVKVEAGLNDVEQGRVTEHNEVFAEYGL